MIFLSCMFNNVKFYASEIMKFYPWKFHILSKIIIIKNYSRRFECRKCNMSIDFSLLFHIGRTQFVLVTGI
jgi:hypothetical protein